MSARRRQSDSDPLPFVQVDRAVKPKVALLAGSMGVSTQHALGSLVEFWDLCGDPRELERVVDSTPEGQEPELVLDRSALELRFHLASGCHVGMETLAVIGIVEPRGEQGRVRGMSRYFDTLMGRRGRSGRAAAAGKASAEARKKTKGTAQPRSNESSEVRSESVRTLPERLPNGSRTAAERLPNGTPNVSRTPPNPRDQRSEIRDQRQLETFAPPEARVDERHAPLRQRLVATFERVRGAKYPFTGRDAKSITELLAKAEPDAIDAAWAKALVADYPKTATLAELVRNLAHFIGKPKVLDGRDPDFDHAASWGVS